MGILPLVFVVGESSGTYGIDGSEKVTIDIDYSNLKPNQEVSISLSTGKQFKVKSSLKTDVEINYFRQGGVLPLVLRLQVN